MNLYLAIFLATLSTVVLPLPEEATLLAAGYAARLGRVSLGGGILSALAAILLGDAFTFLVGRELLARLLATSLGRRLLEERWRRWAERVVAGHGARAAVVARFLVGLRGFVYLALGASRYPFARFLAVDALAGAGEVGALVGLGYVFGELRARVGRGMDLAIAGLLVLALFGPLAVRRWMRSRERARGQP